MVELLRRLRSIPRTLCRHGPSVEDETQAYLALIASLPRPTRKQTRAFVRFVADAHSWYKHLPFVPPGVRFSFYLDPNAGRGLVIDEAGHTRYVDRVNEADRFHYTWMLTSEYRARFGYWNYHHEGGGTYFLWATADGTATTQQVPGILDTTGEWIPIPDSVLRQGSVRITSWIHEQVDPLVVMQLVNPSDRGRALLSAARAGPHAPRYEVLIALCEELATQPEKCFDDEWTQKLRAFHAGERAIQMRRLHAAALRALALFESTV